MTELSDEEVFGATAPPGGGAPREMSDEEVFGSSSAGGAFYRGAKSAALPAAGGLAGAGAGAVAGEMAAPIAGPAAPAAAVVFPIVGAIAGGFGGAAAIKKAQDMIADVFGFGESDAQKQADAAQHPVASFLGELAPNVAAFRPQSGIMLAGRLFSAGIQGGIEAGQEYATDGKVDPVKTGIATAFGAVFTKDTELGSALMDLGGRGASRVAGIGRPRPDVVPAPIAPIQGSPTAPVARSEAARTGIPEVDSVLDSPTTKAVIDNPVVDRTRDVPYMAGGSTPLADPTVYIDRHVPKEQTVGGVTFDPADPWIVHENVEQHTMGLLIKGGMKPEEAYRVAHFEFAEPAEQAWYRAHGIDQAAAEKEQASWLPKIQHENPENPPPNLYDKPYPHADVKGAEHESVEEAKPSPEEKARAFDIIRNAPELKVPPDHASQAQQLGVLGDRPSVADGKPDEAAAKTAPPNKPPGTDENTWEARFDQFVGKLQTPGDVKQLIRNSATENDNFVEARKGAIPLAHVQDIADAAGVDAGEINQRGLGRTLRNDDEVRVAMRLMLQATENVKSFAKDLLSDQSDENFIKFQEHLMRRDLAVEQIVGLRAEWGRTGNVFQQFMREVKDAQSLNDFIQQACPL